MIGLEIVSAYIYQLNKEKLMSNQYQINNTMKLKCNTCDTKINHSYGVCTSCFDRITKDLMDKQSRELKDLDNCKQDMHQAVADLNNLDLGKVISYYYKCTWNPYMPVGWVQLSKEEKQEWIDIYNKIKVNDTLKMMWKDMTPRQRNEWVALNVRTGTFPPPQEPDTYDKSQLSPQGVLSERSKVQLTERQWPEPNEDKEFINVIGRLLNHHDLDSGAHNFNKDSIIERIKYLMGFESAAKPANTQLTENHHPDPGCACYSSDNLIYIHDCQARAKHASMLSKLSKGVTERLPLIKCQITGCLNSVDPDDKVGSLCQKHSQIQNITETNTLGIKDAEKTEYNKMNNYLPCPGCNDPVFQEDTENQAHPYCSFACEYRNNPQPTKSSLPLSAQDNTFHTKLSIVLSSLGDMLLEKNKAYGDSALNPINIFAKGDPAALIRVRIDDKITRIKNLGDTGGDTEDAVSDLIGYLILLQITKLS